MTDELKNVVRQMQDSAVPFFKAIKEDGAKIADLKKRAFDLLQAEREKHRAEEEEEAKQAELEQASAQERAAEQEAAAKEAESKRLQAREAAAEKKRTEKAAFEARVREKRERKAGKGGARKAEAKAGAATARSAGALSERAGGALRRKSSPQRGTDDGIFPLKTGLEQFQQGEVTERSRRKKEDKRKQSLMEGWKEVSSNKPLIVRSEPSLESEVVGEISPGSLVQLLEDTLLEDGTRRVRTNRVGSPPSPRRAITRCARLCDLIFTRCGRRRCTLASSRPSHHRHCRA